MKNKFDELFTDEKETQLKLHLSNSLVSSLGFSLAYVVAIQTLGSDETSVAIKAGFENWKRNIKKDTSEHIRKHSNKVEDSGPIGKAFVKAMGLPDGEAQLALLNKVMDEIESQAKEGILKL